MPEFKAHHIWPTPIFENFIDVKDEWISFCKNAPCKRTSDNNGWISIDKPILEYDEMVDLKNILLEQVSVYVKHHLHVRNNFKITTSWVTKHDKGDFAQIHSHKNSLLSGVYYLQTTENCGDLIFNRDKFLSESFMLDLIEPSNVNTTKYKVPVEDGKLLLFPSILRHGTPKMMIDDFERIAISFNMWPHGIIGEDDCLLDA